METPSELAAPFFQKEWFDPPLIGHRDNMERIKGMSGKSDMSSHEGHGIGYAWCQVMGWVKTINHKMVNLNLKSMWEPKMSQNQVLFVQANLRKSYKEKQNNYKSKG
jgi:hypothetical protein